MTRNVATGMIYLCKRGSAVGDTVILLPSWNRGGAGISALAAASAGGWLAAVWLQPCL